MKMALTWFLGHLHYSHINCFHKTVNTAISTLCRHQHISAIKSSRAPKWIPISSCKHKPLFTRNLRQFVFSQNMPSRTLTVARSNIFNKYLVCRVSPCLVRHMSKGRLSNEKEKRSTLIYICAVGIFMLGMSYAGVPLYRMFCQAAGLGGQATKGHDDTKVESMSAVKNRIIRVRFNADVASSMRWNFKPQQTEVKVLPGETALAFYTAKNPTEKPIIGISTYNVVPYEAGQYFNKIQCFCFEEQILNPHEQVDMPVFFFIDPEYAEDPKLEAVDTITLSYTFFEAKEGLQLPLPGFVTS